jgi:Flp pilus assembly protein TadD
LLGFTDWNRYDALNVILDRIQGAPFTNQVDHVRQLEVLHEQLAKYRLATKPAQVKREAQQVSQMASRFPADPDLRWNLAALLETAGDVAGAEEQWRTLVSLQPQAAFPRFNLAKLLEGLDRQPEAASLYGKGLAINPEYYPARYALGLLCLRLNRLAEAVQHLGLAVRQKPASIEVRLAFGQALARTGRSADAEKQLQEVLRLDPNNASALSQLKSLQHM